MNYVSPLFAILIGCLFVSATYGQETNEKSSFNQTSEHEVGVGLAITSFSSNFTYYVSPFYAYRTKRHWIAATPFYGRLDALAQQQDIGIGVDYCIYPFKNLSRVRYYIPVGLHYVHTIYKGVRKHGMLYGIGVGSETDLGKKFRLALDANFAMGQTLGITGITQEDPFGSDDQLNFYFLPRIRISYRL